MKASRFDEIGDRVIERLEAGESVARTATAVGVPEPTIRTWAHRGRSDPRGRFGRVAAAVDRARRARAVPVDPAAALPSRAELLRRLERHSAEGSVAATLALLRLLPDEPVEADDQATRLLSLVS